MAKPPFRPGARTNVKSSEEARQTFQRLRLSGGGTGEQGPAGLTSLGNTLRFWRQYEMKENLFTVEDPLFYIPPGWGFVMLRCGAYCYAANGNSPPSGTTTWRIRPAAPLNQLIPNLVNLAGQCSDTFSNEVAFWHWEHPLQEGPIAIATTSDSGPEDESGYAYDYWPNVPFMVNPDLSSSMAVVVKAKYGETPSMFPGANLHVWGEYIVRDDIEKFTAPFTVDGSCPIYPKA